MDRKIICLTPIKNEAWILDTFLKATSLWADHIIIADQGSTDHSREIAKKYPKVILIENEGVDYNESTRQKLLLEEARKIEGSNNIFMALDADELLVNIKGNPEWDELQQLAPGTTVWLPWLNVLPGNQKFYGARGGGMLFGYINDGRVHQGNAIHSPRLPSDLTEPTAAFGNIKILHFQYAFKERLLSKHRWYECFEKIKFPEKNNIDIYRQYHHIDLPVTDIENINDNWLKQLSEAGILLKDITDDQNYWWDKKVCELFDEFGVGHFSKQAIWYKNWNEVYKLHFPNKDSHHIYDPRTVLDKWVHEWLAKSQPNRFGFSNKVVNKLLRLFNW